MEGDHQSPCDDPDDTDPGNLRDRIDEDMLVRPCCDRRALDGGLHYTPEDIERVEAERRSLQILEEGAP